MNSLTSIGSLIVDIMTTSREVILYVSQPYKKYRWVGYLSTIQIGFVILNFILMPTARVLDERTKALQNRVRRKPNSDIDAEQTDELIEKYELNPDYDPATVWQRLKRMSYKELLSPRNIVENITERPYVSLIALSSTILISSAFMIYCRRMAHIITLLPNDRVRFTSFSPFAIRKPTSLEVPLQNVSCVQGRKSQTNYSILKFKGFWGYHLIHKTEGHFLEPKLFDQHLGYAKAWATKK